MRRWKWYEWGIVLAILALVSWLFLAADSERPTGKLPESSGQSQPPPPAAIPTAAESLLEGYADPATPALEDLRKLHRVVTGYYSVVKDPVRNPIGGNADLAAALRGENPNREVFVRADHPVFSAEGLLVDRWGSPLVVHPEAWRELELRSAGPDREPYTKDDLVLTPSGIQPREE